MNYKNISNKSSIDDLIKFYSERRGTVNGEDTKKYKNEFDQAYKNTIGTIEDKLIEDSLEKIRSSGDEESKKATYETIQMTLIDGKRLALERYALLMKNNVCHDDAFEEAIIPFKEIVLYASQNHLPSLGDIFQHYIKDE